VVKLVLGGLLLAAVLVGGWFAADRLTSAEAGTAADSVVLETTVKQLVTVREKGKLVTKTVPVVKRVVRIRARTQTQTETQINRETALRYATQVVTAPGKTRVVRRVVTTKVPVVTTKVVKQNGKTRTVAVTSFVPTTRVETQVQTQTQRVTQTQPGATVVQTSTQNHTTTQTTTQVQTTTDTQTVTQTQTTTVVQPTTITNTQTVTDTVTSTVTETVTAPAITVCVPGPC
jgi:hypothetical protein